MSNTSWQKILGTPGVSAAISLRCKSGWCTVGFCARFQEVGHIARGFLHSVPEDSGETAVPVAQADDYMSRI